MYLTTQFPAFGFDQFWVSPPEYFEFREINQSFASVGAFTTGEVNLTAGDRPLRVRSASVNDDLMNALGVQPAVGRLFSKGETDLSARRRRPDRRRFRCRHSCCSRMSCGNRRSAASDLVGQTIEVNGLPREVIGIMPPAADVMDNRTELWTAAWPESGQSPESRQPFPVSDRTPQGRSDAASGADRIGGADSELGRAGRREESRLRSAQQERRRVCRIPVRGTSCRWSRCRRRSSAARAARSGFCRRRSDSSC